MAFIAGDLHVGQWFEERVVTNLSRSQIVQYAGASDDFNPLHTDEVYATHVAGYPSVIAHGMLTMGLTAKAVTNLIGGAELVRFGGRFVGVVLPGDDLVTRIAVAAFVEDDDKMVVDLDISTTNQDHAIVFSGGAVARIALVEAK
jgi:acyl dehydratase